MTTMIRTTNDSDLPMLVLLHNATHEPHFHETTVELERRSSQLADGIRGRIVAVDADDQPIGAVSYAVHDFDRPDRAWVDFAIHPDHVGDDTASDLTNALIDRVRPLNIASLWTSIREDYLPAWPTATELGFTEVHRTFGGGFFLGGPSREFAHDASSMRVQSLANAGEDGAKHARDLYAMVRGEKVVAMPTLPPANDELELQNALESASFVAFDGDTCIGLCIAEPSPLGAWLEVVAVHPGHRRKGVARSLVAATLTALREQDVDFLNTAGAGHDDAYLGLLRSLGAAIEPDWIAYERMIG